MIDPTLLALSTSNTNVNMHSMDSSPSITQAASPIASTSSFCGNGPATPASASWDMSLPDVYMGGAEGEGSSQGWEEGNVIPMDSVADLGLLPELPQKEIGQYGTTVVDKGKGKAVDFIPMPTAILPPLPAAQEAFRSLLGAKPPDATFVPSPTVPDANLRATRKLKRDEIIKRAQEKRQRLQEELNNVKMRLWETTVEQAGLVHLVRQLDEVETRGSEGSMP